MQSWSVLTKNFRFSLFSGGGKDIEISTVLKVGVERQSTSEATKRM